MPIGDWQFWIVTLAMLVALWFVLRPLLPRRRWRRVAGGRQTRAELTVEGRPARAKGSGSSR